MSLFFRAYALPSCSSNFLTVFIGTLYGGAIQQTRLHVGRHRCLQRGLQEPQEPFDPNATMKVKIHVKISGSAFPFFKAH